jgi:hypothetical protein
MLLTPDTMVALLAKYQQAAPAPAAAPMVAVQDAKAPAAKAAAAKPAAKPAAKNQLPKPRLRPRPLRLRKSRSGQTCREEGQHRQESRRQQPCEDQLIVKETQP